MSKIKSLLKNKLQLSLKKNQMTHQSLRRRELQFKSQKGLKFPSKPEFTNSVDADLVEILVGFDENEKNLDKLMNA